MWNIQSIKDYFFGATEPKQELTIKEKFLQKFEAKFALKDGEFVSSSEHSVKVDMGKVKNASEEYYKANPSAPKNDEMEAKMFEKFSTTAFTVVKESYAFADNKTAEIAFVEIPDMPEGMLNVMMHTPEGIEHGFYKESSDFFHSAEFDLDGYMPLVSEVADILITE